MLAPLLRLRQACCHPQAVKGEFLPLHLRRRSVKQTHFSPTNKKPCIHGSFLCLPIHGLLYTVSFPTGAAFTIRYYHSINLMKNFPITMKLLHVLAIFSQTFQQSCMYCTVKHMITVRQQYKNNRTLPVFSLVDFIIVP